MDYSKMVNFPAEVITEIEVSGIIKKEFKAGVKVIVQVLIDNYIGVVVCNNSIPSVVLNANDLNTCTVKDGINFQCQKIGIHPAYIGNVKIVTAGCEEDTLFVYYTFMCPKEFVNENDDYKITADFSTLPLLDSLAVREAIQLLPSL